MSGSHVTAALRPGTIAPHFGTRIPRLAGSAKTACDEVFDEGGRGLRLFDPRQVTGMLDELETGVGEVFAQLSCPDFGPRIMTPME